jgi:CheY-like chemotaxis protein
VEDSLQGESSDGCAGAGAILLQTSNVFLDSRGAMNHFNANPGAYVRLSVTDNGKGMPPEVMERVFEPFFTTKSERSGTGLGLSVVYGIVQKHGGFIDVNSRVDKGSSFDVYLPAVKGKAQHVETSTDRPAIVKGRGTILLVEDEKQVRDLAVSILKNCGYHPLVSEDGRKAISVYERHAEDIDLVVLDVVMPYMGGLECYRELQNINPRVKVLVITGYPSDRSTRKLLKEGAAAIIEKPFALDQFTRQVHLLTQSSS